MPSTIRFLTLLLATCLASTAAASADRDALIEAWAANMAQLPGTSSFEQTGEDTWTLSDTDLPYEGSVRLIGALIRPYETPGFDSGFSQFGMVEFDLVDLPEERRNSQSYYYWLADRQTLHYSDEEQRWLGQQEYLSAVSTYYDTDLSLGPLSFMVNYGIWILLIALIVFVFMVFKRQTVKARSLMDDSADINQKARENLDRSEAMQNEVLEIARESRDLHRETNKLLSEILVRLQR